MSNQPSTSRLSALAFDRLSGAELMRRGLVTFEGGHNMRVPTPLPPALMPAPVARAHVPAEIPGIIYVMQAPPLMPVKIGFTRAKRLQYRVASIQTGMPYPLKVLAKVKGLPSHEREAHALLADYRLTGEWYEWTPRVQAFVQAMRRGLKAALQDKDPV